MRRPSWLTVATVAALAGIVGVGVTIQQTYFDDEKGDRRPDLQLEGRGRNVTMKQDALTNRVSARAGDVVEFRFQAENLGDRDAHGVTLGITVPNRAVGEYERGTCRIRGPGDRPERRCDDSLSESALTQDRIEGGEAVEVRYRYKARRPPCGEYTSPSISTLDSEETTELTANVHLRPIGDLSDLPRCGSSDDKLMRVIPLSFRHTCETTPNRIGQSIAQLACRPGAGIEHAEYHLFATGARMKSAYRSRRRNVREGDQCSTDPDGEDGYRYAGESRLAGRYMCWIYEDAGQSYVEWTAARFRVYAFARSDGRSVKRIYKWFHEQGGPYRYR